MATNNIVYNDENRFIVNDPKVPQIIKEAVKLAGILVGKGKAARMILNFNRKTSTIDDVKIEIDSKPFLFFLYLTYCLSIFISIL